MKSMKSWGNKVLNGRKKRGGRKPKLKYDRLKKKKSWGKIKKINK